MDRCASNEPIGCVTALFKIMIFKSTLERISFLKTPDFLQLRAYTTSSTGVRYRILRAYFVELDPLMILEKTVWEYLVASQSCEHPYMRQNRDFVPMWSEMGLFSRNAEMHGWSMERNF